MAIWRDKLGLDPLLQRLEIRQGNLALLNALEQMQQRPRGKSEKRILGNRVRPKNRAHQILAGFVLEFRGAFVLVDTIP